MNLIKELIIMLKIQLTREDLRGSYYSDTDCPIARHLKRKGYNVEFVSYNRIRTDMADYKILKGHGTYAHIRKCRLQQSVSFLGIYPLGRPTVEIERI